MNLTDWKTRAAVGALLSASLSICSAVQIFLSNGRNSVKAAHAAPALKRCIMRDNQKGLTLRVTPGTVVQHSDSNSKRAGPSSSLPCLSQAWAEAAPPSLRLPRLLLGGHKDSVLHVLAGLPLLEAKGTAMIFISHHPMHVTSSKGAFFGGAEHISSSVCAGGWPDVTLVAGNAELEIKLPIAFCESQLFSLGARAVLG
ncbi:hypothetical protein EK904_000540 [Melospiza melodia maxima]|nr:hypothetical protein EK904_000540 [Melospiza melodia maxima]